MGRIFFIVVCCFTLLVSGLVSGPVAARQQGQPPVTLETGLANLFGQRDYAAAAQDFNRYVKANKNDPAGYVYRGISRIWSGDRKGGRADLDYAIKRIYSLLRDFEGNVELIELRARANDYLGNSQQAAKDREQARTLKVAALKKMLDETVVDIPPELEAAPLPAVQQGLLALKDNALPQALAAFNAAIRENNRDYRGYLRRGQVYALMGDHRKARTDLVNAIKMINQLVRRDQRNPQLYSDRNMAYGLLDAQDYALQDAENTQKALQATAAVAAQNAVRPPSGTTVRVAQPARVNPDDEETGSMTSTPRSSSMITRSAGSQ